MAHKQQTRGCPQGSCSGPALWNLIADEALAMPYPSNTSIQAFADDFLLVAAAKSERALGTLATEALRIFKIWSDRHGLQISTAKTSYLLLSSLVRGPSIFWEGRRVKRVRVLKYLGLHIDEKLSWSHHIHEIGKKAHQHFRNLQKIAGGSWGLSQRMRIQLYRAVAERTLAHAASAWSRDITQKQIEKLNSIQRLFLLNLTGAYRTAPTAALQIIAGIMPLHLKLKMEAHFTHVTRLSQRALVGTKLLQPTQYEKKAVGWQHHPSASLGEN
ncbi:Retrovirus-related Pol polyprotein from type-1 retrotransposable element R1, partial [Araneus ventricosus]